MNVLDFYIKLFTSLRDRRLNLFYIVPRLRGAIRRIALKHVPKYLSTPFEHIDRKEIGVIVSFTSFPARINNAWQVVECMKRQSCKPEKIILWLSKEQFPSKENIPLSLRQREDNLFEIRMVDDDIRSHKKYYYSFLEYRDKIIITIDDDVYYHTDTIKYLLKSYKLHPNCVIANNTKRITYHDGKIRPYAQWESNVNYEEHKNLVQIGVGGVLYPINFYTPLLVNKELFLELAPLADDLWLNAIARLQGIPIVQTDFKYLIINLDNGDAPSLSAVNLGQSKNDLQLESIENYFKNAYSKSIYIEQ